MSVAAAAHADPVQWHAEAGTARAFGGWQGYEYGSGGNGAVAVEFPFGRVVGLQLEAGGLWLPHVNPPQDPTIASQGDGTALATMGGVRLHPFGEFAGPWVDANAGYVRTGNADCFGFDTHLGYDWRVDEGRLDVGPYVGYLQVVGPSATLRSDDASVVSIGLHVAMGRERPHTFIAKAPPPPASPPAPAPGPPSDRDQDGVVDAEDVCPSVPGVRTDDPATNGCPPHDEVRVVDDHIEYDDVILFDTASPLVTRESWPTIHKLAKFISDNADIGKVDIEGHADERGTDEYNLKLSAERAQSVLSLLVRFGVDPSRLTADAYGKSRPRSPGHTEDDWRQNRRVDFVLTRAAHAPQAATSTLGSAEKRGRVGVEEKQR